MKPSDPLLLANVALCCGMYPAGKVDISGHLAIPGFPQSDHTVGKPSVDCVVKHSRPPDLKSSSNVSLPFTWITGPQSRESQEITGETKTKKMALRRDQSCGLESWLQPVSTLFPFTGKRNWSLKVHKTIVNSNHHSS